MDKTCTDIIMAFATVVIAISTCVSCCVAYRIHQSTQKRDKEVKNILKRLTAATLVGGRGVGYEETMAKSFNDMLKELDKLETK